MARFLTALPVFNEAAHVDRVIDEVLKVTADVLVVDDGSSDGTSELLAARVSRRGDIRVVSHAVNSGYGAALATAFREALRRFLGRPRDDRLRRAASAPPDPRLRRGRDRSRHGRRHRERQPVSAAVRGEQRAAGGPPPHQRRDHRRDQRAVGPRPDRRLLRIQGLHAAGPGLPARDGDRLRHAARGLGAGGRRGPAGGGGAGAAAVPGSGAEFRGALDDAATRLAYYRRVLDRAEAAVAAAAGGRDASS